MAYIRKLKNGTFQAAVYIGTGCDKNGNPKKLHEYITADTEKECRKLARELENDIENRAYSPVGKMRFANYAAQWIQTKDVELSTKLSYEVYIKVFNRTFGNSQLKDIKEMQVKAFLANLLKTLSPNTVKKYFFILSSILNDALKIKNPCRDIAPPKKIEYLPFAVSDHHFDLILATVEGTFDEIPIRLAGECGLRLGEILALKIDDIDFKRKTIRIDESRSISADGYILKRPKSARGIRTVVASDKLIGLLRQKANIGGLLYEMKPHIYSRRFSEIINIHNKAFDDPEFVNMNIGRIKSSIVRNIHIQSERLPDIRFHDLRHYHAYFLYKNGIPDLYAAERLGHDVMILKKIYQHMDQTFENQIDNDVMNILNVKDVKRDVISKK